MFESPTFGASADFKTTTFADADLAYLLKLLFEQPTEAVAA